VLKVWLPLPQSDSAHAGRRGEGAEHVPVRVEPRIGKEKLFGNQFAYFEFTKPRRGATGAATGQDHRS